MLVKDRKWTLFGGAGGPIFQAKNVLSKLLFKISRLKLPKTTHMGIPHRKSIVKWQLQP